LWGLDPGGLAEHGPCAQATPAGLECFKGRGTWDTLRALNRPALIWLTTPEGRSVEALVTALTDSRAQLKIGDEALLADIADVMPYWTGEYLILWKKPDPLPDILSIGMQGPAVAWLRDRLVRSRGEAPEPLDRGVFDDGLRNQVVGFQQSRGLAADGIVGPTTLVHLVGAYPESGEPVLTPKASSPGSTVDVGHP
jgi:general secretion pathway protein A